MLLPPPAQNSLCRDLIGALCTGFNLGDGLARLRIQLFVLNPVNVALLAAQLYAQLRSLSKASQRASACSLPACSLSLLAVG